MTHGKDVVGTAEDLLDATSHREFGWTAGVKRHSARIAESLLIADDVLDGIASGGRLYRGPARDDSVAKAEEARPRIRSLS